MKQIRPLFTKKEIAIAENEILTFDHFMSVEDFLVKSPQTSLIVNKIPALKKILISQKEKEKGLQPAIVYETVIVASLASYYNLNYIESETNKIRAQYVNGNITLLQYGSPDLCDCVLINDDKYTYYEIKKELSRAGEKDLKINEEGFISDYNGYEELIPFLQTVNIFENANHNIPIGEKEIELIFSKYFENIDYVLTFSTKGNFVSIIPTDEIIHYITYKGSEIRTSGKNWVKTKMSLQFLTTKLLEKGTIVDGIVTLPINTIEQRTLARGKRNIYSEWRRIFHFFRIDDKDIINETEEYVSFKLKDIKQNKPTICVHINFNIPELMED